MDASLRACMWPRWNLRALPSMRRTHVRRDQMGAALLPLDPYYQPEQDYVGSYSGWETRSCSHNVRGFAVVSKYTRTVKFSGISSRRRRLSELHVRGSCSVFDLSIRTRQTRIAPKVRAHVFFRPHVRTVTHAYSCIACTVQFAVAATLKRPALLAKLSRDHLKSARTFFFDLMCAR